MSFPILQRPSPNHGPRPVGVQPSVIVLHADGAAKLTSSLSWILQRKSGVSYHYLIGREGHVYECVDPRRRAWHAGPSAFGGVKDCNNFAIGVCLSNDQLGEPFSDKAVDAAAQLCASLMRRFPKITLDRITTHAAVALPKGRKADPGPLYPLTPFLGMVQRYHESEGPPCAA